MKTITAGYQLSLSGLDFVNRGKIAFEQFGLVGLIRHVLLDGHSVEPDLSWYEENMCSSLTPREMRRAYFYNCLDILVLELREVLPSLDSEENAYIMSVLKGRAQRRDYVPSEYCADFPF